MKLSAAMAAVAIVSSLLIGVSPQEASASDSCPDSSGFMGRDVLDVYSWGDQVIPSGQYPDYSQYGPDLSTYSPCQWVDEKYDGLRDEISGGYFHAQLAILAGENSNSRAAKGYYQFIAKREIFPLLASAMVDWATYTEDSAANALLKEFWEKELSTQDLELIHHQLVWHYTFMGELEGRIGEIYEFIDTTSDRVSSLKSAPAKVKAYAESFDKGWDTFQIYKQKQIVKSSGALPPLKWVDAYMDLLMASENIVIPTFYKAQRSAIQGSWMGLIGDL